MKKKSLKFGVYFTVCFNVLLVLFIVVSGLFLKNYFPRTMNADEFISYMKSNDCQVVNMRDEAEYDGVYDFLVSDMGTCPYLVSYMTFSSSAARDDFFKQMSDDVLNNNTSVKVTNKVQNNLLGKYYKYSTSGHYYKIVALNNDSVLYAAGENKYEKSIKKIVEDFGYKYDSNIEIILIVAIFIILMIILYIVCLFGTFKKTRKGESFAFIPFYNMVCLVKDVFGSRAYAFLFLVPFINVIFALALFYGLGKVFNKSTGYCILLMLLPTFFWPILAYDGSKYKPIKGKKKRK